MRAPALLAVLLLVPSPSQAVSSEAEIREMLRTNSIIQAAVGQAKSFSGARECEYSVKIAPSPENPRDNQEYSAEIVCSTTDPEEEGAGVVRVNGWLTNSGLDEFERFTLEIEFVG